MLIKQKFKGAANLAMYLEVEWRWFLKSMWVFLEPVLLLFPLSDLKNRET